MIAKGLVRQYWILRDMGHGISSAATTITRIYPPDPDIPFSSLSPEMPV
jgi:hypothetical protein